MSKIRIYELARELGVDNKVIIARANELGFQGKSSHSHSLDLDQADKIRRAIIRQAMGTSSQPQSSKREVITKRVHNADGRVTTTVVEKRHGDVIMRRRRPSESEGLKEVVVQEAVLPLVAPEEIEEDDEAVTYSDHEPLEALEEEEGVVAEVEEHEVEEVLLKDSSEEETTDHGLPEAEVVAAPEEEAPVEASSVPEKVVEESAVSESEVSELGDNISKKVKAKVGPRVLGKIELPTARRARERVKTEVLNEEDELFVEELPPRRSSKVRSRKKEFLRTDLVDYEGGEARRGGRGPAKAVDKRKLQADKNKGGADAGATKASKRTIKIGEAILVGDLAKQMSLKAGEVIQKLIGLGVMATINQAIDRDTATILADEFGFIVESTEFDEDIFKIDDTDEDTTNLVERAPVVTVMGHVDHGKTSLLDFIRNASVAEKEHGGITQHIGAYQAQTKNGRTITFIDTPGHAAFTAMRARGAEITDIVVLVVAADDGVMPQTIEAINHAKAAKVPIVVAVNKMDKRGVNPDRVKQQLSEYGLQPEEWGGDTMFYPVSALTGDGVDGLLEGILLVAEVKELRTNPERRARGTVLETRQERGIGMVATVLIQAGTLNIGDVFVAGVTQGRVRSMMDYRGERIQTAVPSVPVAISGLSDTPQAGDDFFVVESESQAREITANRAEKIAQIEIARAAGPISLEEFARRAGSDSPEELNVIVKADVHGSLEAVCGALEAASTEKVKVKIIHGAVGGITESDIQLAVASSAIVLGFGVRGEPRAISEAEQNGIQVRFYRVIYELIDDVKNAMVGLLDPEREEVGLGRAEVRETFTVPKIGTVAGVYISDGIVKRGADVRVVRDGRVIYEGKMSSLRRFKDDVKQVQSGYECGMGVENFNDIKIGDVLEVYEYREVAPTLH
jgi:translation initiation factor IF-2